MDTRPGFYRKFGTLPKVQESTVKVKSKNIKAHYPISDGPTWMQRCTTLVESC